MNIQEFECLNLRSLVSSYYPTAPYMPMFCSNLDSGVEHKLYCHPFEELYNTGTILSTVMGCGVYDYKKLKSVEDLQMLAARGIALLT